MYHWLLLLLLLLPGDGVSGGYARPPTYRGVATVFSPAHRLARRGQATYYTPSNDACSGHDDSLPDQLIAAISTEIYGNAGQRSRYCGRCLRAVGPRGHSVVARVVDACPTCSLTSLDLSPAAFVRIAQLSDGVVNIQWSWAPCSEDVAVESSDDGDEASADVDSASSASPTASLPPRSLRRLRPSDHAPYTWPADVDTRLSDDEGESSDDDAVAAMGEPVEEDESGEADDEAAAGWSLV